MKTEVTLHLQPDYTCCLRVLGKIPHLYTAMAILSLSPEYPIVVVFEESQSYLFPQGGVTSFTVFTVHYIYATARTFPCGRFGLMVIA